MSGKFINIANLKFMLHDVLHIDSLTDKPYFKQHNKKTFDLVFEAAVKLSKDLLHPFFKELDLHLIELSDGAVTVHPQVKKIMKEFGKGGWISFTFPEEHDGEQLPSVLNCACFLMFSAANYSGTIYPGLTAGAARLIAVFGDKHLQSTYLSNMLNGKWQGTMALTEPQAGSSLSDIESIALPTNEGYYRIKGNKVFISAGDHDAVSNVIHLMLARIEGAPAGVKGISLFVVPQKRPEGKGKFVSNDVAVSQIFHKMGYRGAPTTELIFGEKGDCRGWLVGEAGKGLAQMFMMMNEERIGVGTGAAGIASAAYEAALEYAASRPQGRKVSEKNPETPQVSIIQHADVKRMLLFQRAVTEGAISLLLQCAYYEDMAKISEEKEKERYELLLDLLTPIAKTYPSEMGILSVSQSIQIFGGYGYCDDFPVEQHYRDMRIHPIHEGTTGIQGMDLLGRKVIMKNGQALKLFMEEVGQTIKAAKGYAPLAPLCVKLEDALKKISEVTMHLVKIAMEKGPEIFLSDAVLYLESFGIITVAWQWLSQAVTAFRLTAEIKDGKRPGAQKDFYEGKIMTARYFYAYELPKISGLFDRLTQEDPITVEMKQEWF